MTELAYLPDMPAAYVRDFRARITALPPGGVVLERTYFYPTGGGQPADHGELRAPGGRPLAVVDVTKSGPAVVHRLSGPLEAMRALSVGGEVEARIDWERRYRHMRLHTGQHLLSACIYRRCGVRTLRAALAGAGATLDLERPLPPEAREALEGDVREAIEASRPVSIRSLPRGEWDAQPDAGRSGLVPLAPQVDPVRVVVIDGTDQCPCGGTHVRSTGEIGGLRLRPFAPRPDGAVRVAFSLEGGAPSTPSE
ncbi:MAG TPA: alanyl-tRNA editing protein [Thermoplasmata archaeon]|nr:alanyl-tRNA editing protein [Thermoplasmata archaeon]